jgi:hypothetical protein
MAKASLTDEEEIKKGIAQADFVRKGKQSAIGRGANQKSVISFLLPAFIQ